MVLNQSLKNIFTWLRATRGRMIAVMVVSVCVICACCGVAVAKYIASAQGESVVYAQEFYFTSDLLDEETHTLAADTESITFTLGNHADDLRYSEMDISYVVKVTDAEGEAKVAVSPATGTLSTGDVRDVNITLSGLQNGKTYTVTATANGGYAKTLSATIKVQSAEAVVYKYLDTSNSEFALLTVWSLGYEGDVEITFPNSVAPDNTDTAMRNVVVAEGAGSNSVSEDASSGISSSNDSTTGSVTTFTDSATFKSCGYTSHVYRFFKSGSTVIGNLSASSFTVTYGSNSTPAEVKKPS